MSQGRKCFLISRTMSSLFECRDCFFEHAIFDVDAAEAEVCWIEERFLLEQRAQVLDGAVVWACKEVRIGGAHVEHEREGIELAGTALRCSPIAESRPGVQIGRLPMPGPTVAGIQLDSAQKFFF